MYKVQEICFKNISIILKLERREEFIKILTLIIPKKHDIFNWIITKKILKPVKDQESKRSVLYQLQN